MPVVINRTISIKDKDGNVSILTATDQVAESTDISTECDSSRCASRHDGKPKGISWNIEEVKEKPEALPDDFFRLIHLIVNPRSQEQKVFCSAGCARDFLQYDYTAPLSPREEAVLQATNEQAELAKRRPKTNVIPFPARGGKPLEINAPTEAPTVEQEATPLVSIDTEGKTPVGAEGPVGPSGCPAGAEGIEGPAGAPLSPREEAVLQATNQQAELAKHRPKTNVVPFPTKAPVATVEAPPDPTPLVSIDTEGKTPVGAEGPVGPSGCPAGAEGIEGPAGAPVSPELAQEILAQVEEARPFTEREGA